MKKISIIVMTFNRKALLNKCLNSLFNQDYPKNNYEIIVVDDASKDNTKNFIKTLQKKHKNLKYIKHKTNKGVAASRNTGIKNAKHEIIAFIADDYILPKNYIKEAINFFKKYKNAKIVKFKLENIDNLWYSNVENNLFQIYIQEQLYSNNKKGIKNFIINLKNSKKPISSICKSYNFNANWAVVYKKELFKEVGNFNEYLTLGEDVEFGYRLAQNRHNIYYNPIITIKRKIESNFKDHLLSLYNYGKSISKNDAIPSYRLHSSTRRIFYLLLDLIIVPFKRLYQVPKSRFITFIYVPIANFFFTAGIVRGYIKNG